jgi:hypothetical protein
MASSNSHKPLYMPYPNYGRNIEAFYFSQLLLPKDSSIITIDQVAGGPCYVEICFWQLDDDDFNSLSGNQHLRHNRNVGPIIRR